MRSKNWSFLVRLAWNFLNCHVDNNLMFQFWFSFLHHSGDGRLLKDVYIYINTYLYLFWFFLSFSLVNEDRYMYIIIFIYIYIHIQQSTVQITGWVDILFLQFFPEQFGRGRVSRWGGNKNNSNFLSKTAKLGGGFKYFWFSPLPGEMIQFD